MRRTNAIVKAIRANTLELLSSKSPIPRRHQIVVGAHTVTLQIFSPKYKEKSEFLEENNPLPFVDLDYQQDQWLYEFAGNILEGKANIEIPFFNPSLDYTNPGMAAFKVSRDDDFFQVQVHRTQEIPTMFQLDYFEPTRYNGVDLKMILLCDVSDSKSTSTNLVYVKDIDPSKWQLYASKVSTAFRDILIYMRVWDYSEDGKICTVSPIPGCLLSSAKGTAD